MDDACLYVGGRRRNFGWIYMFDEDLQLIAHPSGAETDLPGNAESLVHAAALRWSKQAWRGEMLTMINPSLSARVFTLSGPSRTCIVVYLEEFHARAER